MKGSTRRTLEILLRLAPFAFAFLRDRRRFVLFGGRRRRSRRRHQERASRLADTLLELGATFIKVGQVLSTRPDLVPPVYAEELQRLQDQVPPDTSGDPRSVLKVELADGIVDRDTLAPVAGGSLAYVYRAERHGGSERIALKVRRPDIKTRVERDLRIIRRFVPIVSAVAPEQFEYSLGNLADDFESIILQELDFEREARMMDRISDNVADDRSVRIPAVDMEASTERVLIMEYVDGTKITDADAFDDVSANPTEIAERIADVYLRMGLRDGLFHADPHPGNLALDDDGRLVLYDFGMAAELSDIVQTQIIDLYIALGRRDIDGLIDALIRLGALDPHIDRRAVRRALGLAIDSLRGQPHITWQDIFAEVSSSLRDFPFRIPPDVMLLVRVGAVAEGVCRSLDPEFDFLAAVRSYLVREGHATGEVQEAVAETAAELLRALPSLARLPRRLDTALDRLERGELESGPAGTGESADDTGQAVIAAGLFIAAAVVYPHDPTLSLLPALLGTFLAVWVLRRRARL